jgi:hypothetical protein
MRLRFVIQTTVRDARTGVITRPLRDTSIRIVRVTGLGNTSSRPVSQVSRDTVAATSLALLLPQTVDTASFVMVWDTARLTQNRNRSIFTDTLRVRYRRRPYFVSEGCGFNYKFDDLAIVSQTFSTSASRRVDSVYVANSTVNEEFLPHIVVRFTVRPR